jgi:hypothetical protein
MASILISAFEHNIKEEFNTFSLETTFSPMNATFRFLLFFLISGTTFAQVWKSKKDEVLISFFSETPIENIQATSKSGVSLIKGDSIIFSVRNTSFDFEKDLMEEHFNENYMESSKYPVSTFKGKINEKVDLTKAGSYQVTCTGVLNMHGVAKTYTFKGTITVKGEEVHLKSEFDAKLVDHKIDRPQIVMQNIAEVIRVKVDAKYMVFKKP